VRQRAPYALALEQRHYTNAWAALRLRERQFTRVWLGGGAPALIAMSLLHAAKLPNWAALAVLVAWCVATGLTALRWVSAPCPRCRRAFVVRPLRREPDRCLHCRLLRGASVEVGP
jgi:hypothetical protein